MFVNNSSQKQLHLQHQVCKKTTVSTATGSIPVEVYLAPEDNPIQQIINVINNAKYNIYFDYLSFTDDNVRAALINAKNRVVNIEGVFDSSQYGSNGPYGELAYHGSGYPCQHCGCSIRRKKCIIKCSSLIKAILPPLL